MKLTTQVIEVKSALGNFTMKVVKLSAKIREKVLVKKVSAKNNKVIVKELEQ